METRLWPHFAAGLRAADKPQAFAWRASGLGNCPRKRQLASLGLFDGEELPPDGLWKMEIGRQLEDCYLSLLGDIVLSRQGEVTVATPAGTAVSGHYDALVQLPGAGLAVLEIKTISQPGFAAICRDGAAKPEHRLQAQHYMAGLGVSHGCVLYLNLGTKKCLDPVGNPADLSEKNLAYWPAYECWLDADRAELDAALAEIDRIVEATASGNLVPAPYRPVASTPKFCKGDWQCTYCPYGKIAPQGVSFCHDVCAKTVAITDMRELACARGLI